jgi:hypothetical protein
MAVAFNWIEFPPFESPMPPYDGIGIGRRQVTEFT